MSVGPTGFTMSMKDTESIEMKAALAGLYYLANIALPTTVLGLGAFMCLLPLVFYEPEGRKIWGKTMFSFSSSEVLLFLRNGGYQFKLCFAASWVLFVLSFAMYLGTYQIGVMSQVVPGVIAVLAQVLMLSSLMLYRDVDKAWMRERAGRAMLQGFLATNVGLAILGGCLSLVGGLDIMAEQPTNGIIPKALTNNISVSVWTHGLAALAFLFAIPLTQVVGGHLQHGCSRIWQPFQGGLTFVALQCVGWLLFIVCLSLMSVMVYLSATDCACYGAISVMAGATGVGAEILISFSLAFFDRSAKRIEPLSNLGNLIKANISTERTIFQPQSSQGPSSVQQAYNFDPGYLRGKVHAFDMTARWFRCIVLLVITGMSGSGTAGMAVMFGVRSLGIGLPFTDPMNTKDDIVYIIAALAFSSIISGAVYFAGCWKLEHDFNDLKKGREEEWKIQPKSFLSDKLHREEVVWGVINAMWGSCVGMMIYFYHVNTGGTYLYTDIHEYGLLWFFVSPAVFWIATDCWAYFAHRMFHKPLLYKRIHKWHHRYTAPTAFSAFAMHPLEFSVITVGVQLIVFVLPIHLAPLIINLAYIAVHAVKDHSGIDFDGDFPWQAPARFHDDHHKYFHCNFGQSLLCWDLWCGTLRKMDRKYGESTFYGKGDVDATGAGSSSSTEDMCQK